MKKIINWFARKEQMKPPAPEELEAAKKALENAAKSAVLGEIGGKRPGPGDVSQCWWGGNFLGKKGEGVPINRQTGNPMQPVLQFAVSAMPILPERLDGITLINLWMDLKGYDFWEGASGSGFVIREYEGLEGLVPIGLATPSKLPIFPIFWKDPVMQTPTWEDFSQSIPSAVAKASNDDWFFKNPLSDAFEKLQPKCPIKLGGWPTWIQGAGNFEGDSFVFQVDSTDKGQFHIGDAGSLYFFKTSSGWVASSDCF